MGTPPESDTVIAGHLDATYVGRIVQINDEAAFSSLTGPIAEICHTADAVIITVKMPMADEPLGEIAPSIRLRVDRDGRVLIRR
ncbi:MAG: hypothetical protein DI630_26770 [Gordonia sp. (in: high G+C Gram-positive bacteria)]|nr:MAG: hypothetical protein DI630_26770 [Gordonia sp. (in: high G+C Gram-positive bacteria)]